ncbi:hypothetical protein Tco_0677446 [Tanacetum coccineum]|uniref:Uncharacterized protein n=1 Tax=Tanacetum coccineum TaxID=301880 RepID=A0ABQ4XC73_9ASTR
MNLLSRNDNLFDLESKKNEWKKILYDAPIDDVIFDPGGNIDKTNAFLDIDISTDIEDKYHYWEGDILYLKSLLSNDTILTLPPKVFLDHNPRSLGVEGCIVDGLRVVLLVLNCGGIEERGFRVCGDLRWGVVVEMDRVEGEGLLINILNNCPDFSVILLSCLDLELGYHSRLPTQKHSPLHSLYTVGN